MALEQTLSIIKPDAISKGFAEEICQRLEEAGLKIHSKRSLHLTEEEAEGFYIEHKGKPFFSDLIITEPPLPPSPPSGPPYSMNFSLLKLGEPSPPLPALTYIFT